MSIDSVVSLAELRQLTRTGRALEIRKTAGLSAGEVARAVGVSVPTIRRWEEQERVPRGDCALRYADLLARLSGCSDGRHPEGRAGQ